MRRVFGVGALVVVLSACAPMSQRIVVDKAAQDAEALHQKSLALEGQLNDWTRLFRVAQPLLVAAQDICPDNVRYSFGVMAFSRYAFGDLKDAAMSQGFGETVRVHYVLPGFPGEAAGVKAGDFVESVNGKPIEKTEAGWKSIVAAMDGHAQKPDAVTFGLVREGNPVSVTVMPRKICGYPAIVSPDQIINAFADGRRVIITAGMMRFATTDQELALVVGHEIAHNAMGHIRAQTGNRILGAILDGLIAGATRTQSSGAFSNAMGQAFSQDFEAEADQVGLYLMARAGMEIKGAPQFWRRMATANPRGISGTHAASHPPTSYRLLALEKAVTEIAQKQAKGESLVWAMKPAPPAPSPFVGQ